jgi:molybdate transport system substrate-binding protein
MKTVRWSMIAAIALANLPAAFAETEIRVIAPGGIRAALEQLLPGFESKTGYKVKPTYGPGPATRQMVARGDAVDVAILQTPYEEVLASGNVVAASATPIATISLGVAVKKGASKPDVSTTDAVKRTLLGAKSVAYPDPANAAAGQSFDATLKKLGLTSQLEPKLRRAEGAAGAMKMTSDGEAEIGVTFLSEMGDPGVDIVGALPREIATPPALVGFISAHAKDSKAAKALLDYLSAADAAPVYKKLRMQPGR